MFIAQLLTDGLLMICSLVHARRGLGFGVPFPSGDGAQGGWRVPPEGTEPAGRTWKTPFS